jgi:aerobic C4-dicarboxylate transport protein
MLQVIFISVMMGICLVQIGERGNPVVDVIDSLVQALFRFVSIVMRSAPIGAGAGVAYTIGRYGVGSLISLGWLMLSVYITSLVFIVVILGSIARWSGFPLLHFLRYFKDEIFQTCSTEAVLPRMMVKLERLGCERSVVGLVLPTGYTFNADGTSIYLTMAAIVVAQATNTPLTIGDQFVILGVLLLTSKGSAGGRRLRDAGSHTSECRDDSGDRARSPAWRRPVHERGTGSHQSDRQRDRDDCDRQMGWCLGSSNGAG